MATESGFRCVSYVYIYIHLLCQQQEQVNVDAMMRHFNKCAISKCARQEMKEVTAAKDFMELKKMVSDQNAGLQKELRLASHHCAGIPNHRCRRLMMACRRHECWKSRRRRHTSCIQVVSGSNILQAIRSLQEQHVSGRKLSILFDLTLHTWEKVRRV